jgi:glutamyl-tRNA synthetase
MPVIDAIAEYMGIKLPEINVVDFSRSGYLPETMVNFLALLGWSSGDKQEIMTVDELIAKFDITRLAKSNSLFDRKKLVSFNTEHMRMVGEDKLLGYFKIYLKEVGSVAADGDDELLAKLLKINVGARGFEDVERKSRFLFFENDKIDYNAKAVKKVLMKADGLEMLKIVGEKLNKMAEFTEEGIENMLRGLAQEKQVGLGKVAQPLRVAICGNTVSPPIFDSVQMLGKENTLTRIDHTLKKFKTDN